MLGLMDCNNFFVSCERLFRPDLLGKPVAVLSSNDGCVVARSQEVKDLGIPMGVPYFEVKELCEKHCVTLFSSNFTLYRDLSRRVMHALREEFDHTEVYSVDEAFFEVPSTMTIEDIKDVRERIMQKTGIPVSIGIAPTKTIAKIANAEAKKGQGTVWLDMEDAALRYREILCGSVWGIGRHISKRLSELEVIHVDDLLKRGLPFMRQEFGVVGERLFLELSGTRTGALHEGETLQASIMSSRSFPKAITDKDTLMSAIGHHVSLLGQKLREKDAMATELSIVCAPSRFSSYTLRPRMRRSELEEPTNDTATLLKAARELLDGLYEEGVPYKKAGAVVTGLMPAAYVAPSLFREQLRDRSTRSVYEVVDTLNERFGRSVVHAGVVMHSEAWTPRSHSRSKEYTTRWSDIARVKAI